MNQLKVLQAPGPICGQSWALARGLESLGYKADSGVVTYNGDNQNKYGYPVDTLLPVNGGIVDGTNKLLKERLISYDIVHFHAKSFFTFNPWPLSPTCMDILALRMLGKKVFFHFRGSEVRRKKRQLEKNPFNYVDSAPEAFSRSDEQKAAYVRLIKSLCNGVFVVDREVDENVGGGVEVPICLDLNEWKYVGKVREKNPLIIHAPSHQGIKGTEEINQALGELKAKNIKFDYIQIENMPHSEARALYERADIVIDQLKMGWFGTLTVEAMALGKPAICFLREDLLADPDELPIVNANPNNIKIILEDLLLHPNKRESLGVVGRDYVENSHCCIKAAENASKVYQKSLEEDEFDMDLFFECMQLESNTTIEYLKSYRKNMRASFLKELKERSRFAGLPGYGRFLGMKEKYKNLFLRQ